MTSKNYKLINSIEGDYKYSQVSYPRKGDEVTVIDWNLDSDRFETKYNQMLDKKTLDNMDVSYRISQHIFDNYMGSIADIIILKGMSGNAIHDLQSAIQIHKSKKGIHSEFNEFVLNNFYILTRHQPIKIDQYKINETCDVIVIEYTDMIVISATNIKSHDDTKELVSLLNYYYGKNAIICISTGINIDSKDNLGIIKELGALDCWKTHHKNNQGHTISKINSLNTVDHSYRADGIFIRNHTIDQLSQALNPDVIKIIGDNGYVLDPSFTKIKKKENNYFHLSPRYGLMARFYVR